MKTILFILFFVFFVNCDKNPVVPSYPITNFTPQKLNDGWETGWAGDYGFDTEKLDNVFKSANSIDYQYSLLVIKNKRLVAERYFNGQKWNDANHIHSVTKSFTGTLVGLALDKGYVQSLDQRVLSFFPEYHNLVNDSTKFKISIKNLLTMRGGFEWWENKSNWDQYTLSISWVKNSLLLPLRTCPGIVFNYCSPESNLLSGIVQKATNMSTRKFAETILFNHLGVRVEYWSKDPFGYYAGAHSLFMTPRDMAKLGLLYLENGFYKGQKVLSKSWIEQSTRPICKSDWNWGPLKNVYYGYHWWVGELNDLSVYFASGLGGQCIMVVPKKAMVIVTTTNGESWETEWRQIQENMGLISKVISCYKF